MNILRCICEFVIPRALADEKRRLQARAFDEGRYAGWWEAVGQRNSVITRLNAEIAMLERAKLVRVPCPKEHDLVIAMGVDDDASEALVNLLCNMQWPCPVLFVDEGELQVVSDDELREKFGLQRIIQPDGK